jgi:hypothetical protein
VILVSPSKISINGALAGRKTASFTTLKLSFAPEPSSLLLLGAGALALLISSRRSDMKRLTFAATVAVLLLATGAAHAGSLTMATWLQVTQGFPMTRTTAQLGATGTSTAGTIAVNLAYPAFATAFFVPKTPNGVLDLHIKITQGGPQAITATPGMALGTPGIPGTVILMTAVHIAKGPNVSMYNPGINTLLQIPVSVGHAGQAQSTFTVSGQAHYVTVAFYGWTAMSQTFTGLTSKFVALPDVVAMGSFNLTGMGGGTVTLVSPTKLSINGALAQRRTVTFTALKLSFLPEPAALLLLGASALGVLVARRS